MYDVLTWEEAEFSNTSLSGGKGLNLAKLHNTGFRVPDGIILTTNIYLRYIQYNNLEDLINSAGAIALDNLNTPETFNTLESIQSAITLGEFPVEIIQDIEFQLNKKGLLTNSLAVRSSAASEDSNNHSFAGIHESYLDVIGMKEIITAVKKCFASVWSLKAVSYRRTFNIGDKEVYPAVVIMKLVEAQCSGVAFTCHPLTGKKNQIIIHANFGLGETLVSGAVDPDEYIVESRLLTPVLVYTKVGRKEEVLSRDKDSNRLKTEKNNNANKQVLKNEDILRLSKIILRIYESIGNMNDQQDIEWVFDGIDFYIVQTRSITVIANQNYPEINNENVVWSNANFKDVMPNVQSFLSWNIINTPLEQMVITPLKLAGYPILNGVSHTKLYNGRAYMNLTALQWEMYDAFNLKPDSFNVALGGHQPQIAYPDSERFSIKKIAARNVRKVKALFKMLNVSRKSSVLFKDKINLAIYARELLTEQLPTHKLIDVFYIYYKELVMYTPNAQALNTLSGFYFTTLESQLKKKYGDRTIGELNKLLQNKGKITSAEQGLELQVLAGIAKTEHNTLSFFNEAELNKWREVLPDDSTFKEQFIKYLDKYGHRGSYELDISNPRWREQPEYLLGIIQQYIQQPDIEIKTNTVYHLNRKEFAFLQYGALTFLLKKTIRGFEKREEAKSVLAHLLEIIRLIIMEIGKRLEEQQILDDAFDIFYLGWNEILSLLQAEWDGKGISNLIKERCNEQQNNQKKDYPNLIIDDQPNVTSQEIVISKDGAKALKGIGVAAGKAKGICKVVQTPLEGVSLTKNDIMVTNSTDPSWTPLFLKVGGVVMETGGYLSHSAIVAREYGIPTVVNVLGVMDFLKDGMEISVDGNEGLILVSNEEDKKTKSKLFQVE